MTTGTEITRRAGTGWRNRLLAGAGTVVALAIVVFVAGSLSPAGLPKRQQGGDGSGAVSTRFVHRAEEALKSGDTTLAAQLAEKAIEAAPDSAAAKSVQAKVAAAKKSAQAGSSSGESSGSGSGGSASSGTSGSDTTHKGAASGQEAFSKPGVDLKKLVPSKVSGFDFTGMVIGKSEIQKSAQPVDPRSPVANAIWTVREMGSADQAASFINKTSKQLYRQDNKTKTVDGVKAFFGTDGERYATCSYVRGRYVFELLATSTRVAPAEIESQVIKAAEAFSE